MVYGTSLVSITWTAFAPYPSNVPKNYTVYKDESIIQFGSTDFGNWSRTIIVLIDPFTPLGVHNFTILVTNVYDMIIIHTVWVTVELFDTVAPIITSPGNMTFEELAQYWNNIPPEVIEYINRVPPETGVDKEFPFQQNFEEAMQLARQIEIEDCDKGADLLEAKFKAFWEIFVELNSARDRVTLASVFDGIALSKLPKEVTQEAIKVFSSLRKRISDSLGGLRNLKSQDRVKRTPVDV